MLPERVTAVRYKRVEQQRGPWGRIRYSTQRDHMARYFFAANLINGKTKTIIDAASGSGWGTHYLSTATQTERVIGLDYDPEALDEATREFPPNPKVSFQRADLTNAQDVKDIDRADWVVSFETLEHVPYQDSATFLQNLSYLHNGKGGLVISTPNAPLFSPYTEKEGSPWYKHHHKEYNLAQFVEILEQSGWGVNALYGQRFVNKDEYLRVARLTFPFRLLASRLGVSWDHRLYRLPIMFLSAYYCLKSDSQVRAVCLQNKTEPVFLVAVCSKKT